MAEALQVGKDYPGDLKLAIILVSLFLGTFLVAIDTTIISVAIPKISTEFHAFNDISWYGSVYLIFLTALQPAGGTVYKFFNIKFVYLASILIFEGKLSFCLYISLPTHLLTNIAAGSALCAAAPNSKAFIVGRAIAGTGAAGVIQGAITVITYISTLEKRPLYIGLVVSCFGICACFSPILGGVLTDRVSGRWCFWMFVQPPKAISYFGSLTFSIAIYRSALLCLYLSFSVSLQRSKRRVWKWWPSKWKPSSLTFSALCCYLELSFVCFSP